MSTWVKVAAVDEIPESTGKEVVAGDRIVALFRTGDSFYALDGICPHAGGPLANGFLNGTTITCPWHGRQFDVQTGRDCLNSRLSQPCFPVKVEDSAVWIELPEGP